MPERWCVWNTTRSRFLATAAFRAHRWPDRLRGLLGTVTLPVGHGLLITPCRQVHMRGMAYAVCAVYCDRYGRVLACPLLQPGARGPWVWRARTVIELPVSCAAWVRPGDVLAWWPRSLTGR
ncbi:DUF192 domain-containing protein [Sulfobacillus thermosulfidooxidans]|uniref:DUF192 domain-containing protein n=1 Tax=Sulfobacillus thermosulfidooxidans TaxID=28034 RepID=UPI00036F6E60|nr:DUF192 domain-containing protein [Sulfobacillus thermosulfidooxidans]